MANPTYPGTGLSPEQERAFSRDGFLLLEQVISVDELGAICAAASRAEQRWLAGPRTVGSDQPFLRRVEPLIEYDDELLGLLDHPAYFPVVRELLGNGVAILDTAYFITPPGAGWGPTSEWHIDEGLTGPSPAPIPLMVKVSIPLDDVMHLDDGPTALIPGSHQRSYEENLPSPPDPRVMPGLSPVFARAGDVYIFHGRVHHAAMPNTGRRTRRVLQLNYGHIWMKAWPGHEPSERLRSNAESAIKRQLLHVSPHHYQHRLP